MSTISQNIQIVKKRIADATVRSGRSPEDVRLVAVSKTFSADRVEEAIKAGQKIFGENRVQEAREKIPHVGGDAEWHMIGRLQKNKAKYIPGLFTMVHSVDSFELAEALDRAMERAAEKGVVEKDARLDILVQVNIAREERKGGVDSSETEDFIKEIAVFPHLKIKGLMTIPPYTEDPEDSRAYYSRLREVRDLILMENIPDVEMFELSMGMSGDYEVAVEEGATLVRVGSAIFGKRDYG